VSKRKVKYLFSAVRLRAKNINLSGGKALGNPPLDTPPPNSN